MLTPTPEERAAALVQQKGGRIYVDHIDQSETVRLWFSFTAKDHSNTLAVAREIFAREIATARAEGMRDGMERAYEIADECARLDRNDFATIARSHIRAAIAAPVTWSCTRASGHDGPCAAKPVKP